jgi:hypothetical protein
MASDKQIAANRANAKRSTGPKTALGKSKSSRNALRHGLSCSLKRDALRPEIENLAQALVVDNGDEEQCLAATALACAQWELMRIRSVRARMMAAIDLSSTDAKGWKRLMALDRYERLAHTSRRRAFRKLASNDR